MKRRKLFEAFLKIHLQKSNKFVLCQVVCTDEVNALIFDFYSIVKTGFLATVAPYLYELYICFNHI